MRRPTCLVPSRPISFQLDSLANIGNVKKIGMLSLGLGMATDFVIAAALCFFLRSLRTGHGKYVLEGVHDVSAAVNLLTPSLQR